MFSFFETYVLTGERHGSGPLSMGCVPQGTALWKTHAPPIQGCEIQPHCAVQCSFSSASSVNAPAVPSAHSYP